jgi:hypothetical protein
MMADAIETVGLASHGCCHGIAADVGTGGARKCRTWSRLLHTGQSDAS